ncbi:MAG: tail fiber protein [Pseudomonadota bacterium]|uniref:phage tail protein n=1 Tax=Sphingomonas sp. ERG5 TaxID=1381597 RepID=UPI00054B6DB0|nr:tail fiber protein [Sphingomonas sp. ERG5]
MSNPFVAEIRIFGFNFAPRGWAFCAGQILPISQNTALFSLLGTTYGGNGTSTFALPDLRDRAPMAPGQGPGLSDYVLGEQSGERDVTLLITEMPAHDHVLNAATLNPINQAQNVPTPNSGAQLGTSNPGNAYSSVATPAVALANEALLPQGGGQPHDNLQPYLTLNFCIALQGVFPARN